MSNSENQKSASSGLISKFFSLSPIHGFGFIIDSETKIERIVWYSCMAISLFFLTVDTYRLYDQYWTYAGTSYTKLIMNNSGIPAQVPMDICVELNLVNHLRELLPENFTAEKIYLGEQWDDLMNNTIWNRMRYIAESGGSHFYGIDNMYVYVLFSYFQRMFDWEYNGGIPMVMVGGKNWRRTVVNNNLHQDMVELEAAAKYWNISVLTLLEDFQKNLFILLGGNYWGNGPATDDLEHPGVSITSENFGEDSVFYGDDMQFCYRLQLPERVEKKPEEEERSIYKIIRIIPNVEIMMEFDHIKSMKPKFTVQILDSDYDLGYGTLEVKAGEHKTANIDLNGVSISLPKENNRCSTDGLLYHECQLKCKIDAVEKVCGCTPIITQLLSNVNTYPLCNYTDYYKTCLRPLEKNFLTIYSEKDYSEHDISLEDYTEYKLKVTLDEIAIRDNFTRLYYNFSNTELDSFQCQENCLPSCRKSTWTLTEQKTKPAKEPKLAVLALMFRSTNFPVFQEVPYPMEIQNFISSMGGNMGVWFGASFLSIIHMALCTMKYMMRKFGQKKNKVMNDGKEDGENISKIIYSDSIMKTMP